MNNLKTRTAMNEKISALAIYVELIINFLLHDVHDCNFKRLRSHSRRDL